MKFKSVYILSGIIISSICVFMLWYFNSDVRAHDFSEIDKNSKAYMDAYKECQDFMASEKLEFKYPLGSDEYGATTEDIILNKEYGYGDFRSPCIVDDYNEQAGRWDGHFDFFKKKFGPDFLEKAKQKADSLDNLYRIKYYKENLGIIISSHLTKHYTADSVETWNLNLKWLDNTPFNFVFDTSGTEQQELNQIRTFKSTKTKKVEAVFIRVKWKTDCPFPYKDIPFVSIILDGYLNQVLQR